MDSKKRKQRSIKAIPFGGNYLRLSPKELAVVLPLTLIVVFWIMPAIYRAWEKWDFGDNFRLSYNLRDDYWSYQQWCDYACQNYPVVFIGDSVIWGMYTDNEHTLPAHYNRLKEENIAANLGIDGLHPVALENLVRDFGGAIKDKKVYLYFNALWMNDPKFDLSAMPQKDESGELETISVMHPRLAPQFDSTLYCYNEPLKKRIANTMERNIPFFSLANHLRSVWFSNQTYPEWMLDNPDRMPWAAVERKVNAIETEHINRDTPWNKPRPFKVSYDWVMPYQSRQWEAFINTWKILKERGNEVVILLGAFNTHLLDDDSLSDYEDMMDYIMDDLDELDAEYIVMEELPSECYADASHPLDPGYEIMAEQIIDEE